MHKYYLSKWGKRIGFTTSAAVAEIALRMGYLITSGWTDNCNFSKITRCKR